MSNLLGIIGDMHLGVKNGDANFLDFQFLWLEDALQKMQEQGIKILYQTGDLFDTRTHMRLNVMHAVITKLPQLLDKYEIEQFHVIAGNHDVYYRDHNAITALQIIDLLNGSGCKVKFSTYTDDIGSITIAGKRLDFVPWLNKNNQDRLLTIVAKNKADYVLGHFEMVGMPMIPGVLCEHGVEVDQFKNHKRVISGHFHTVSESKNCTMVGTPYHITWNDVQDGNNRGFWILNVETDEFVLHKNEEHMTLFSVIEYDPEIIYDELSFEAYEGTIAKVLVKSIPNVKHHKKFIELINKVKFIDFKVIDTTLVVADKVIISQETLSLDTLSAMNSYINLQSDDFNKTEVKALAESIYMEVLTNDK